MCDFWWFLQWRNSQCFQGVSASLRPFDRQIFKTTCPVKPHSRWLSLGTLASPTPCFVDFVREKQLSTVFYSSPIVTASHTPRRCVKLACKQQVWVSSSEIILRCSKSSYRLFNFRYYVTAFGDCNLLLNFKYVLRLRPLWSRLDMISYFLKNVNTVCRFFGIGFLTVSRLTFPNRYGIIDLI